jgi:hypothetical protein
MNQQKQRIRNIINKIINEDREPLKDPLEHDNTVDVVHALHTAWEGGENNDVESENLVMPIDHVKVATGESSPKSIEVIDHTTGAVTTVDDRKEVSLEEARLRIAIRNILSKKF